ncbi:Cryptochrome/photolyase FAD-binding domain-containing protein [Jaminaea rosea]|uniref:Cryptochrome/photolyase FAD-binding domain-containing protein n=1 Tax=Jaminaea rosea TaxID=1569628 RepID=A0A316UNG5_9BASI|nr:Cryptochrome/photolyase FAD-binding domain-containing protein [Jaminaea rosea]PWN24705.1 Cryptochrome/photolyase FAD-binding domain-containing protein [Jaminaea rosea]
MAPKAGSARVLYWFRTDLRLHDSPALAKALALSPKAFFPVFNFDPHYAFEQAVGARRFRFLLESMQDLSDEIRKINKNSQLLVTRGDPRRRIKELCEKWEVTHVAFEEDHNDYGRTRDAEVRQALEKAGIEIVSCEGHHLYPIKEVLKKNGNKPTTSMSAYQKAISSLGDVPKPTETPKSLPDPLAPGSDKVDMKKLFQLVDDLAPLNKDPGPPEVDVNHEKHGGQRHGDVTLYDTVAEKESDPFAVPTLKSLGMDEPQDNMCKPIRGGSSVALKRLDDLCKDPSYLATFAKPQTSPSTDPDAPSTTLLSPYIKFGCLGIRYFWHKTKETKKKHKGGGVTDIPEGMEGQLLFRDMYAACEAAIGDAFHGVRGNSMAKYFDWYLPDAYDDKGNKIVPRPRGDEESEKRLAAWESGTTGFPWIDANMRMLRQCGWMHHLGRHSTAAFLTRAQCFISWERGAEVYSKYLLDWDPSSNSGNWMWLSATAFFSQFFRVYGLATFPAKYDKDGYLVRKFCPELKDVPKKYIYSPHLMSDAEQKQAKCIIGKDYPAPILDEKEEKQHCLDRMGYGYKQKLMGDAKEVMNGSAEDKFRKGHGIPHPALFEKGRQDKKIPDWAKAPPADEALDGVSKENKDEIEPHETDNHDHEDNENDETDAKDVKAEDIGAADAENGEGEGSKESAAGSKRKSKSGEGEGDSKRQKKGGKK